MDEWEDIELQMDKYLRVKLNALISPTYTYDLLLGLNVYKAIGGNLTPEFLKYNIIIDNKERWGKIPLIYDKLRVVKRDAKK